MPHIVAVQSIDQEDAPFSFSKLLDAYDKKKEDMQVDKYKLLKDLPWLSIGSIIWIENGCMRCEDAIFAASCYEETLKYFWVDDEGNFNEKAIPNKEWFAPLIESEPKDIKTLGYGFANEDPENQMIIIADRLNKVIDVVNALQKGSKCTK